jgi:hypothetical protein
MCVLEWCSTPAEAVGDKHNMQVMLKHAGDNLTLQTEVKA